MADSIFIDTWGWLTLRDRREQRHTEVVKYYRECRVQGCNLVPTDYVLDETFTLLFKRLPAASAQQSMDMVLQAIEATSVRLEWITPDRFSRTAALRRRYHDKPDISFTDLTSITVMLELGLVKILTGDNHFTHV